MEAKQLSRDFLRAIREDDVERVRALLSDEVDARELTEKERWSFLHRAFLMIRYTPSVAVTECLINGGADVNAIDCYGNSVLHYAVKHNDPSLVEVLLKAGADPNVVSREGFSPLRQAVYTKSLNYEVVALLVAAGADPKQKVEGGKTVSELAATIAWDDQKLASLLEQR